MHPPLLISTAGRRKNQRSKGSSEGGGSTTRRKGHHRCDVRGGYGHRWYTCKDSNPEDKAVLLAESWPPKKKKKKTNEATNESTEIVAISGRPTPMYFPPSPIYKNNHACMLCRSVCGSSQPDALSIGPPVPPLQPTGKKKRVEKAKKDKRKGGNKPKGATKQKQALVPVPPQSPAMCTRSKALESPAMSTRSKRKILD
ncbi:hypothetical protein PVAP13_6NG322701 [Panicum virgatum]|uniref:Uncharacterized protein n=1 Tax=Panicum virgatum TaxID=38727 RepID=A0A8T0R4Y6_PANVG|nr:hypothetical protein PVAP13_6NG322701 [Panicum virgatum]